MARDSYYRGLTPGGTRQRLSYNFDHPDAIDVPALCLPRSNLCSPQPRRGSPYDFVTHSRVEETISVEPADVIIIEASSCWRDAGGARPVPHEDFRGHGR